MAEPMKNRYYNRNSICMLASRIKTAYPSLPLDDLVNDILDETWDALELKARIRRITNVLGKYLPSDYGQALDILDEVVAYYQAGNVDPGLLYFPDFVEVYGQAEQHWGLSMGALGRYTKYSTSEFAVRPFIIGHEERMMAQMAEWTEHEDEHVRRLASEGCRPALPWGRSLPRFKEDPSPILQILDRLKADPSLYVRKSVANNLNDISKTHPDLIIQIAKDWYGKDDRTDWIVKHGCRTLLKKGNKNMLDLFGFADVDCAQIEDLALDDTSVRIGGEMTFSFFIKTDKDTKVRLEYGIDYVKANRNRTRKVFKISEPSLKKDIRRQYIKVHSFADTSSRRHYPGTHSITLIVNGDERGTLDFEVTH